MVKKEKCLDDEGIRLANLQAVYGCVGTTPPPSVESERVFSAVSRMCSNILSSLNGNTTGYVSY
jgi:hypothetical protein